MKRIILLFSLFLTFSLSSRSQYTIPDPAFAAQLQQLIPNAMTGNVLDTNHVEVTSLTNLIVNNTGISDLSGVQFFDSLEVLKCNDNQLASLPSLPTSLEVLYCYNNQLTSLPSLPAILEELNCFNNQLTVLPTLPATLKYLWCSNNLLASHPPLPSTLIRLDFPDNQVATIPSLPGPLRFLNCANNQISCLPSLPNSLEELLCHGNEIYCLPNFPDDIPSIGTLAYSSNLGFAPNICSTSGPCFPAAVIAGTIFNDANGNGLMDELEGPFMNGVAFAQPGNYLSGLDIQGIYRLPVDPGSYSVQGQPVPYHTITTPVHAVNITLQGTSDTTNHIGYHVIPGVYDLVVDIQSGVTRPGFDNNVWLQVKNIGTEPTTATIDLSFDADQTFVSSSIVPMTQVGTNLNWTVPMYPGDTWTVTMTLNTAATVPLGTAVEHLFTAIPASADTTPANNSTTWNDEVVGSYDPNDKTASVSSLSPTQVINGEWIEYLIRFQNTGTFMAEHVRITDVLSTTLQSISFNYISASHDNYWYLSNGALVFQFDQIQLPDSNTNEPGSHGFVKFRIKPNPSLTVGSQVVNIANIYFDFNEPVITDPSVVLIDASVGVEELAANDVRIFPNPTSGELNIVSDQVINSLQLYSSDGRLLWSASVNASSQRIDVSALERGIYLLELSTANGRKVHRVVVEE
ncbi:MAG: T9SS type A sorting domain-containing protein [Bacteroidota bacterium]|nr:T9SS type A sorting domain-containing protein [Bacteroidota bacterium]